MKPQHVIVVFLSTILYLLIPTRVQAAGGDSFVSFALLIGSNAAGEGQRSLAFAQQDAKRMADVLQSLGHTPKQNIHVVLEPDRAKFHAAVQRIAAQLAERHQRGLRSKLFIYYSGHARSDALVLGEEEIPLAQLREQIVAIPSTLTVIFLDACQSGAFSRVKGVEPSEDFSFNSVSRLQAEGIAVMASSSATELSQESPRLRSSFFTHHLVVGLRGAGDADRDGRVTLSEAYRYAYNATLTDTTKTRVGGQHVTLETELRGKGEVVLTYPKRASARIVLPTYLAGKVIIQHVRSGNIVAEMHKAQGQTNLAFPPGEYTVFVKKAEAMRRCTVALKKNTALTVDPSQCKVVPTDAISATKHIRKRRLFQPRPKWALELSVGGGNNVQGDYTSALTNAGYQRDSGDSHGRISAAFVFPMPRFGQLVLEGAWLDHQTARRPGEALGQETFSWDTYGVAIWARFPFLHFRWKKAKWGDISTRFHFGVGLGPAYGRTTETDESGNRSHSNHWGVQWGFGLGYDLMFGRNFGLVANLDFREAEVIKDDQGNRHDSGGIGATFGIRLGW